MRRLIIFLFLFLNYLGYSQVSPQYQNITIRNKADIKNVIILQGDTLAKWYKESDTAKTIYHVRVDSSFIMNYNNYRLGIDPIYKIFMGYENDDGDTANYIYMDAENMTQSMSIHRNRTSGQVSTEYRPSDNSYATRIHSQRNEDLTGWQQGQLVVGADFVYLGCGDNVDTTNTILTLTKTHIELETDTTRITGQIFAPDIEPEAGAKFYQMVGYGLDGRLFPRTSIDWYDDVRDSLRASGKSIYQQENILTVGDSSEIYSDFSTAVAAATASQVIELSAATFTETGTVTMPNNSILKIYSGGLLDGTFTLIGDSTRLEAGLYKCFGDNVTLSGTWIVDKAYPEWFGAKGDSATECGQYINKALSIFGRCDLTQDKYIIKETIDFPDNGILIGNPENVIYLDSNVTFLKCDSISHYYIEGLNIKIATHDYETPTWVIWIRPKFVIWTMQDYQKQRAMSIIKDINIDGIDTLSYTQGAPGNGNGIKIYSDPYAWDYFNTVSNLRVSRVDTAIYIKSNDTVGSKINSWLWTNITVDMADYALCMYRADGHLFSNIILQPRVTTVKLIDLKISRWNKFTAMLWDLDFPTNGDSLIFLDNQSSFNIFNENLTYYPFWDFVVDLGEQNYFTSSDMYGFADNGKSKITNNLVTNNVTINNLNSGECAKVYYIHDWASESYIDARVKLETWESSGSINPNGYISSIYDFSMASGVITMNDSVNDGYGEMLTTIRTTRPYLSGDSLIFPIYSQAPYNRNYVVIASIYTSDSYDHLFWTPYASASEAAAYPGDKYINYSLFQNINLTSTSSSNYGVISKDGQRFIHNYKPTANTGQNTFIGLLSGNFTMSSATAAQSSYNTGIGYGSLTSLTKGADNTAVGYRALSLDTTGSSNVAIGSNSLFTNKSGSSNVSVGFQSMYYNVSGGRNVALGESSLISNTGNDNTAAGFRSLYTNAGGGFNVSFGSYSGYLNSTGSYNIFLGRRAGYNETGSYKSYWSADSTSWTVGMGSGSKLLWYADQSNAAKSAHFMNIFAKVSIGAAKDPTSMLEVTGNAVVTGSFKSGTGAVADGDTTPSVAGYNTFVYAGSATASTTVTDLDNPVVGAYYTFIGNSDTYTLAFGGANFKMASPSPSLGQYDNVVFYCQADNLYIEISRTNNAP